MSRSGGSSSGEQRTRYSVGLDLVRPWVWRGVVPTIARVRSVGPLFLRIFQPNPNVWVRAIRFDDRSILESPLAATFFSEDGVTLGSLRQEFERMLAPEYELVATGTPIEVELDGEASTLTMVFVKPMRRRVAGREELGR